MPYPFVPCPTTSWDDWYAQSKLRQQCRDAAMKRYRDFVEIGVEIPGSAPVPRPPADLGKKPHRNVKKAGNSHLDPAEFALPAGE